MVTNDNGVEDIRVTSAVVHEHALDDQAFLGLIDSSSCNDNDYLALKKVLHLSFSSMVINTSLCHICGRQEQQIRPLMRFEKRIYTFARQQDH